MDTRIKKLVKELGLDRGRGYELRTRTWVPALRRNGAPSFRPSPRTWKSAILRGRYALAVVGLKTTSHVVVDIDFHGVDARGLPCELTDEENAVCESADVDAYLDDFWKPIKKRRQNSKAGRMRRYVARQTKAALERLRSAGVHFLIEASPRGCHILIKLPYEHDIADALKIG